MRRIPKPNRSTPVLAADGQTISDGWDDFFRYLDSLNSPPVSAISPTNGQVLVYDSTTGLYTPGSN